MVEALVCSLSNSTFSNKTQLVRLSNKRPFRGLLEKEAKPPA